MGNQDFLFTFAEIFVCMKLQSYNINRFTQEKIDKMLQKYRAETIDIEDIDYEEPDLEESIYFPTENPTTQ